MFCSLQQNHGWLTVYKGPSATLRALLVYVISINPQNKILSSFLFNGGLLKVFDVYSF